MQQNQLLTPNKLQLNEIEFKNEDVLKTEIERHELRKKLINAMKLGNNHKQKVRIHFITKANQTMEIKAKVWSITEKYVILKNSIMIPISSIIEVNYI